MQARPTIKEVLDVGYNVFENYKAATGKLEYYHYVLVRIGRVCVF